MEIVIGFTELGHGKPIPGVGTITVMAESTPPKPAPRNRYVVVRPHNGGAPLHGHIKEGERTLVLTPLNNPVQVHT